MAALVVTENALKELKTLLKAEDADILRVSFGGFG